jgi:hypothetical protein
MTRVHSSHSETGEQIVTVGHSCSYRLCGEVSLERADAYPPTPNGAVLTAVTESNPPDRVLPRGENADSALKVNSYTRRYVQVQIVLFGVSGYRKSADPGTETLLPGARDCRGLSHQAGPGLPARRDHRSGPVRCLGLAVPCPQRLRPIPPHSVVGVTASSGESGRQSLTRTTPGSSSRTASKNPVTMSRVRATW